jgi:hypothetical protein
MRFRPETGQEAVWSIGCPCHNLATIQYYSLSELTDFLDEVQAIER